MHSSLPLAMRLVSCDVGCDLIKVAAGTVGVVHALRGLSAGDDGNRADAARPADDASKLLLADPANPAGAEAKLGGLEHHVFAGNSDVKPGVIHTG